MNIILSSHHLHTLYSLFILSILLIATIPIKPVHAETQNDEINPTTLQSHINLLDDENRSLINNSFCHPSHRGTRCRKNQAYEFMTTQNLQASVSMGKYCSYSSRGKRCKSIEENYVVTNIFVIRSIQERKTCNNSSRGTRCKQEFS